jgi:hypothetical protein
VIAVVAELKVYEMWVGDGRFAELLRILEKKRRWVAAGCVGCRICATNLATKRCVGASVRGAVRFGGEEVAEFAL